METVILVLVCFGVGTLVGMFMSFKSALMKGIEIGVLSTLADLYRDEVLVVVKNDQGEDVMQAGPGAVLVGTDGEIERAKKVDTSA